MVKISQGFSTNTILAHSDRMIYFRENLIVKTKKDPIHLPVWLCQCFRKMKRQSCVLKIIKFLDKEIWWMITSNGQTQLWEQSCPNQSLIGGFWLVSIIVISAFLILKEQYGWTIKYETFAQKSQQMKFHVFLIIYRL